VPGANDSVTHCYGNIFVICKKSDAGLVQAGPLHGQANPSEATRIRWIQQVTSYVMGSCKDVHHSKYTWASSPK